MAAKKKAKKAAPKKKAAAKKKKKAIIPFLPQNKNPALAGFLFYLSVKGFSPCVHGLQ